MARWLGLLTFSIICKVSFSDLATEQSVVVSFEEYENFSVDLGGWNLTQDATTFSGDGSDYIPAYHGGYYIGIYGGPQTQVANITMVSNHHGGKFKIAFHTLLMYGSIDLRVFGDGSLLTNKGFTEDIGSSWHYYDYDFYAAGASEIIVEITGTTVPDNFILIDHVEYSITDTLFECDMTVEDECAAPIYSEVGNGIVWTLTGGYAVATVNTSDTDMENLQMTVHSNLNSSISFEFSYKNLVNVSDVINISYAQEADATDPVDSLNNLITFTSSEFTPISDSTSFTLTLTPTDDGNDGDRIKVSKFSARVNVTTMCDAPTVCHVNKTCVVALLGPKCMCMEDYCPDRRSCLAGGLLDDPQCLCKDGYTEEDGVCLTQCEIGGCGEGNENNLVCTDSGTCLCANGFIRYTQINETCIDINECNSGNYLCDTSRSECKNIRGSYLCECIDGYEHPSTDPIGCEDVDECESYCLDNNTRSECINTEGSFECVCYPEHEYNETLKECTPVNISVSVAVNECNATCNGENQNCTDTEDSYICECNTHYDGENCTAIDYCGSNPCPDSSHCEFDNSTAAGYRCTCPANTYSVPSHPRRFNRFICVDSDLCHVEGGNICSNNTHKIICKMVNRSAICVCPPYLRESIDGNSCEAIPGPSPCDHCGPNATCHSDEESGRECHCRDGFKEDDKENCVDVNECGERFDYEIIPQHNCNLDMFTCVNEPGTFHCLCKPEYTSSNGRCRVPSKWKFWRANGPCSVTCGEHGERQKIRECEPGARNNRCIGDRLGFEDCNRVPCSHSKLVYKDHMCNYIQIEIPDEINDVDVELYEQYLTEWEAVKNECGVNKRMMQACRHHVSKQLNALHNLLRLGQKMKMDMRELIHCQGGSYNHMDDYFNRYIDAVGKLKKLKKLGTKLKLLDVYLNGVFIRSYGSPGWWIFHEMFHTKYLHEVITQL